VGKFFPCAASRDRLEANSDCLPKNVSIHPRPAGGAGVIRLSTLQNLGEINYEKQYLCVIIPLLRAVATATDCPGGIVYVFWTSRFWSSAFPSSVPFLQENSGILP
jgi:hypothetical protein